MTEHLDSPCVEIFVDEDGEIEQLEVHTVRGHGPTCVRCGEVVEE